MLFTDTYKTIVGPTQASFRDRGSKFMGYAFPVKSEEEVKLHISQLKKEFHDATHHCYAYIIGPNAEAQRANDDGEPANTAGKPIQRAIHARGLTNVLVVVVRYFGGKLLGVPGLINAYGNTATETLNEAVVIEKIVEEVHQVTFNYEVENAVFKMLKNHDAIILQIDKLQQCSIIFAIRMSNALKLGNALKELLSAELKYLYVQ
ncbi:MAG: YigZ family protein [Bacteroidota bacterium]|nr:YigZ family protein [Bacteroidota bacterium]